MDNYDKTSMLTLFYRFVGRKMIFFLLSCADAYAQNVVQSFKIWSKPLMLLLLGPASTVEDRSLRKILVQGDRGSNLAEGFSFQSRIYFAKRIDGNPQTIRRVTSNSRNLDRSGSCCDISTV